MVKSTAKERLNEYNKRLR